MNRWTLIPMAAVVCVLLAIACSNDGNSPVMPGGLTSNKATGMSDQTHLWGYYDVYVDVAGQTASAVLNRNAMFSANVVQFLNGKAANLTFKVNGTPAGAGYVDVDIDVSITHPFSGVPAYNGYDVRGIFIGNGSKTLGYNSKLKYASRDMGPLVDQQMYDYGDVAGDPHPGRAGNPDGYTRWFNPTEFTKPGLFGYTKGLFASGGYNASATLNPYKYFADGLNAGDPLWPYLTGKTPLQAVFSSGQINTSNYYLRFPNTMGVKFSYAVLASWINETTHPAHAPEACGISVTVTPDIYWTSPSVNGGKLKLDMSFPSTFAAQPSTIYVESDVLSSPYQLSTSEMVPAGGGSSWSTYHVEIPANNVTSNSSTTNHEFWVIPQYNGYDYTNTFGVTNSAGTDKLASFFRHDLYVSNSAYDQPPICSFVCLTSMPASGPSPVSVSFDASGSTDPDPGDTLSYSYDFNGDGTYGDPYTGTASKPIYGYTTNYVGKAYAKVSDQKGGFSICSVPVSVTINATKNINVTETGNAATDIAIDPNNGDLLVYYNGSGHVRRWTRASNFGTNSATYNCDADPNSTRIDATSYAFALTYQKGPYWYEPIYTLSGGIIPGSYTGIIQSGNLDIIAWPAGTGTYSQCLDLLGYTDQLDPFRYAFGVFRYPPPTYPMVTGLNGAGYFIGSPKTISTFDPATVTGGEGDADGVSAWWIQSGACTATKWNVTMDFWTYLNVAFGTFNTPGDADSLLNDPIDITRNKSNQYTILDHLSTGAYRIKGFTYSGTVTTPIASFMDPIDYSSGTPIHIDGSDYDDKVIVLIVNGTNSYASIF